jgi:hypothetical protein
MSLPPPLLKFFACFPLHTWPAVQQPTTNTQPTLWVHPQCTHVLSADVQSLQSQAYIALRGLTHIAIRSDVSQQGAIDGKLPNLHLPGPGQQLLPSHRIPEWVDGVVNLPNHPFQGYKDQNTMDESKAWLSLMQGTVHAALVRSPLFYFSTDILNHAIHTAPLPINPIDFALPSITCNPHPSSLIPHLPSTSPPFRAKFPPPALRHPHILNRTRTAVP